MSVCEFIERNGAELLVYRLISIIIAMRTWNEIEKESSRGVKN